MSDDGEDPAEDRGEPSQLGKRRVTEPEAEGGDPAAPLGSQERVGRYVIQNFLAEGGMGVVYVAFDPELGRHVAIKLVKSRGSSEAHLRERLLREAQALAQLSHPNVISVHDVGLHDDRVFIAMELVEGVSLRHWLEQPRSWRATLDVLISAGRGLAAAHSAGIVHRDFKPDNVIVGNDGRVCVLDFGLARGAGGVDTEPGSAQAEREQANAMDATVPGRGPAEAATEAANEAAANETVPVSIHASISASIAGTLDGRERLERSLTRLGTVIGTPAYMSPEHHRGEPVTSLSDQFSFCVAAWEALYRRRPHARSASAVPASAASAAAGAAGAGAGGAEVAGGAGEPPARLELRVAKEQARIAPPPRGTQVPARVRRLLLRGLAAEPGERHPSMQQLLDGLERVAHAPRRRTVAAIAAVAAVALIGLATLVVLASRSAGPRLCTPEQARERLGETWSAEQMTRLDRAFAASGRAHAAETAGRVRVALQGYADQWTAMHVESCAATHVRHVQSSELLDLRTQCLEQRRDSLRALVGILTGAREGAAGAAGSAGEAAGVVAGEVIDRAVVAAMGLPPIERCAEAAALRAAVPLPEEPLRRAAIEEARGKLDDVRAMVATGQYGAALPWAREVADSARALAYPPLLAAAVHTRTNLEDQLGEHEAALRSAREGALVAGAARDDAQLVEALIDLMWTLTHLARFDEALALATPVEALIARTPPREADSRDHLSMKAALAGAVGWVQGEQGKLDLSVATLEEAAALREREVGPESWRLAVALNNLGEGLRALGRNEEAGRRFERALAITERALGAHHPNAGAILNNLATVRESQAKYDEARAMYERSLAIDEGTFGPDSSRVAISLLNLGSLDDSLGHPAASIPVYERALAIQRKALGAQHPDVAMVLHNLGQAQMGLGERDRALASMRAALAIFEATLPADHVNLGPPLTGIGEALVSLGRAAEGVTYYERALALQRKTLGEDALELAPTLHGLADAYRAVGRTAAALPLAERAVAIYTAHDADARLLAEAELTLAQTLWSSGGAARPRAQAIAVAARARLSAGAAANPTAAAELLRSLERWLAAHGGKP